MDECEGMRRQVRQKGSCVRECFKDMDRFGYCRRHMRHECFYCARVLETGKKCRRC